MKEQRPELNTIFGQIKNADSKGYENLYTWYGRTMYGVAYGILKDDMLCYDVIQTVMFRLCQLNLQAFPTENPKAWLLRVVQREAWKLKEKETKYRGELPQEEGQQDARLVEVEELDAVHTLLQGLNERQQQVVSMKILADMPHREIAQQMELPIGTVQWIYHTAIRRLRHMLLGLTGWCWEQEDGWPISGTNGREKTPR